MDAAAIIEILKRELRLVSANSGEVCQMCGSTVDYTWRVKDGSLEHCAALIAALPPAPTAGQE